MSWVDNFNQGLDWFQDVLDIGQDVYDVVTSDDGTEATITIGKGGTEVSSGTNDPADSVLRSSTTLGGIEVPNLLLIGGVILLLTTVK